MNNRLKLYDMICFVRVVNFNPRPTGPRKKNAGLVGTLLTTIMTIIVTFFANKTIINRAGGVENDIVNNNNNTYYENSGKIHRSHR